MSKIEVDAIEPQSGTTLTIGASGDSVNIASGAKITDFTSTGIDDNATSTAITIDGSENVGIGETTPLGKLHVKSADSGATPFTAGDELVVEGGSGNIGMSFLSTGGNGQFIYFGDDADNNIGSIKYEHGDNSLQFVTNASERMRIDSSGHAIIPAGVTLGTAAGTYSASNTLDDYEEGTWTPTFINFTGSGGETQPTNAEGHYTKIGNLVFISVYLNIPANGDSSALAINNIPFTSKDTTYDMFGGSITRSDATITNGVGTWIPDNSNNFYATKTASATLIDYATFSGKYLQMVATYLTDA